MPTTKQGTAKNTAATQAGKQAAAPKHTTAKQAGTPAAAKHTTSHGLMKAVQPSAELAAIVGNKPLPRTEITKRIWEYIKEHGLQDATNKRLINADATLRPLFGGQDQVSMLELPKLMSRHVH